MRLKTIYQNKDEAFVRIGYRNWHHATENFRMHKEPDCHKDYVDQLCPSEQFVMSMKALMKN